MKFDQQRAASFGYRCLANNYSTDRCHALLLRDAPSLALDSTSARQPLLS